MCQKQNDFATKLTCDFCFHWIFVFIIYLLNFEKWSWRIKQELWNFTSDNMYKPCGNIVAFTYREGSVITSFVATFDPAASNETDSTVQAAMQPELDATNTGTFLGPYQLDGTRQTAVTFQGKSPPISA